MLSFSVRKFWFFCRKWCVFFRAKAFCCCKKFTEVILAEMPFHKNLSYLSPPRHACLVSTCFLGYIIIVDVWYMMELYQLCMLVKQHDVSYRTKKNAYIICKNIDNGLLFAYALAIGPLLQYSSTYVRSSMALIKELYRFYNYNIIYSF